MPTEQEQVRTLRILIGALIMGVLMITGVAAAMAATGKATQKDIAMMLLLALGGLAIAELVAYRALVRPTILRQVRRNYAAAAEDAKEAFLLGQFTTMTILAAALIEGVGLFGAVILLITGQWAAIAAPLIAAGALAFLMPSREAVDRFRREVSEAN